MKICLSALLIILTVMGLAIAQQQTVPYDAKSQRWGTPPSGTFVMIPAQLPHEFAKQCEAKDREIKELRNLITSYEAKIQLLEQKISARTEK